MSMEPREREPLSDNELADLLHAWQTPVPTPLLRSRLFPAPPQPWWRTIWSRSIRIPVPGAACLVLLILFAAWKIEWHPPKPAVMRVGIATTKTEPSFYGLQPVAELRPRIIRTANARTSLAFLAVCAALCPAASCQTHYLFGGTALLNNGITVFFFAVAEPPFPSARKSQDGMRTSGNLLQRCEFDPASNSFFGYDLSVKPAGPGQFTVTIGPLTIKPENTHFQKAVVLALPKYPDPQTIRDGHTIALDLLISPDGKQKVVDYIRVVSSPSLQSLESGKPKDPQALFRKFSETPQSPPDFTLDDVPLHLDMPCVWLVNGKELSDHRFSFQKTPGATMWFYFPGHGRFILSLAPQPGYNFERAGAIRNNVISFRWQGDDYEIRAAGPILGADRSWGLYVLNDPAFRPPGPDAESLLCGIGRLQTLLHR